MRELTDENFAERTATGVCVVDFYAPWCGPCKMLLPVVEESARLNEGRAKFYKVNIDISRNIAINYNIMSIPSLVFLKDGVAVKKLTGLKTLGEINDILDELCS